MKAEFQRIARRDKKAFLSDHCKEIEENNTMGKTRDLFKKIRDTKGTFHVLKLKLQYFGHLMQRADSFEKTLMLGEIEGRRRRGRQRMRWLDGYHQLDGHEFEQAAGVGDGQGDLACCSPWGSKVRHE